MTQEWIVIVRQIVGGGPWETVSYWDGERYPSRNEAIGAGACQFGHDDFNIGCVEGNRLVWFGWMDKEIAADLDHVARQLYLTSGTA